MRRVWVAALVALVVGCTPPTMNIRRSGLRGGGDLATTVTLDRLGEAEAQAAIPKIVEVCDFIEGVVNADGPTTVGGIIVGVEENCPAGVGWLIDEIVREVRVDTATTALTESQEKYVLALVRGARTAAREYDVADRGEG